MASTMFRMRVSSTVADSMWWLAPNNTTMTINTPKQKLLIGPKEQEI